METIYETRLWTHEALEATCNTVILKHHDHHRLHESSNSAVAACW